MRLLLCLGFTVGLACAVPAYAATDPLLDGISKIPGAVEDVRIGGTWEKDGKNGEYRVVITRSGGDTVTARLFVQWIAYRDDGTTSVDDTIEIKELAALKVDVVDYTSNRIRKAFRSISKRSIRTATPTRITSCTSPRRQNTSSGRRATRQTARTGSGPAVRMIAHCRLISPR